MIKNNSLNYESVNISIDPIEHPIAFQNRFDSLKNSGLSEDDALKCALEPIEMEMYYDPDAGLFIIEADAVESVPIFNPYSGVELSEGSDYPDVDQHLI